MSEEIYGILERLRGLKEEKKVLQLKQSTLDREVIRHNNLLDGLIDKHRDSFEESKP